MGAANQAMAVPESSCTSPQMEKQRWREKFYSQWTKCLIEQQDDDDHEDDDADDEDDDQLE